jgi:hypothetical protein
VEIVLLALPGVVVVALVALVARWGRRRSAERARLARIRERIGEWLTPEWVEPVEVGSAGEAGSEGESDGVSEPAASGVDGEGFRWFGPGSAGYRRGRSA